MDWGRGGQVEKLDNEKFTRKKFKNRVTRAG